MPTPPISEDEFQQQLITLAKLKQWSVYHTHDSRHSVAGFPDLVFAKPGRRVIFAELKSANGVVTTDQEAWLQTLRDTCSVDVYVWRPDDFEAIVSIL